MAAAPGYLLLAKAVSCAVCCKRWIVFKVELLQTAYEEICVSVATCAATNSLFW